MKPYPSINFSSLIEGNKDGIVSIDRYKALFENSPLPLIEKDFSEIKKYIASLPVNNIKDLRKYFEMHPFAIKKVARLGKIININQAMMKLFESTSKSDFLGSMLPFLTSSDSLKNFENEIVHFAYQLNEFEKYESRTLPSGRKINIVCKSFIVPKSGKSLQIVITSVLDKTQQTEIEEELKNKNKDLIIFIYKVSHDLKSPLASILGLVNVAKMEIRDFESLKYFQMIGDSAQRLEAFLSNLLNNFALAGQSPKRNKINIKQLISKTIDGILYNPVFKDVKIKITSNQKRPVFSDGKILRHVFQNLIDNAAKYKRLKAVKHIISITISDDNSEWLKIIFKDNGCGMDDETRTKIFDLFFRGSGQSTGAGLGLFIVKNSIEKLKGKIMVKSTPGKGSSFIVYLPKGKK